MKLKNVFSLLAALVVLCVGAMAVAAPAPSQLGQSRAAIEVAKAEIPANCNLIGYTTKGDESRITFQDPDTLEYYYVKVAKATSKIKEIEVKGATFVIVEPLLVATAIYFCLCFPTSKLIAYFERRMSRGDRR